MKYEEFLAQCLQAIPEPEREKWLQEHIIIEDFSKPGEWLILEITGEVGKNKYLGE